MGFLKRLLFVERQISLSSTYRRLRGSRSSDIYRHAINVLYNGQYTKTLYFASALLRNYEIWSNLSIRAGKIIKLISFIVQYAAFDNLNI